MGTTVIHTAGLESLGPCPTEPLEDNEWTAEKPWTKEE